MSHPTRIMLRYVVVVFATLLVVAAITLLVVSGIFVPAFVLLAVATAAAGLWAWPPRQWSYEWPWRGTAREPELVWPGLEWPSPDDFAAETDSYDDYPPPDVGRVPANRANGGAAIYDGGTMYGAKSLTDTLVQSTDNKPVTAVNKEPSRADPTIRLPRMNDDYLRGFSSGAVDRAHIEDDDEER